MMRTARQNEHPAPARAAAGKAAAGPATRAELTARIEAIASRAGEPRGIEIVEVELKGSGRNQLLRIYIDRPEGVTHADCEFISREVGDALDADDPFPGAWELEVSSPGVERKLTKWKDWQRFVGKPVKVVFKAAPAADAEELSPGARGDAEAPALPLHPVLQTDALPTHAEGVIARAEDDVLTLNLPDGSQVVFSLGRVQRANLRFEW